MLQIHQIIKFFVFTFLHFPKKFAQQQLLSLSSVILFFARFIFSRFIGSCDREVLTRIMSKNSLKFIPVMLSRVSVKLASLSWRVLQNSATDFMSSLGSSVIVRCKTSIYLTELGCSLKSLVRSRRSSSLRVSLSYLSRLRYSSLWVIIFQFLWIIFPFLLLMVRDLRFSHFFRISSMVSLYFGLFTSIFRLFISSAFFEFFINQFKLKILYWAKFSSLFILLSYFNLSSIVLANI